MKKLNLFILFILGCLVANAKPIDSTTAITVAEQFFYRNTGNVAAFSVFKSDIVDNEPTYYLLKNNKGKGFVIVSGDDLAEPILGYGNSTRLKAEVEIPYVVEKWLLGYRYYVLSVKEQATPATDHVATEWESLLVNQQTTKEKGHNQTQAVAPLVSTQWNQSPYYNDMCPFDVTHNERAVVGCVATAMAQILKYHNWPIHGEGHKTYSHATYGSLSANFGATTYNWSAMPNAISSPNTEVAKINYHCAVAVDMNFGVASQGGSGAYVIDDLSGDACAEKAFEDYFRYKTTLQGKHKSNYSDTDWKNLLKTELNNSRPILYAGFGQGGHAFVCDGYDNNNFFHFNWGWGGMFDGYFSLSNLAPGTGGTGSGAGTYTNNQQAIVGIEPDNSGGSSTTAQIALNADLVATPSSISTQQPFSVSLNLVNIGTSTFNGDYTVALFTQAGDFVDYVSIKNNMSLQPNYTYSNNLEFSTTGLTALAGDYRLIAYYKPAGQQHWQMVENAGSYTNDVPFQIVNPPADISVYAPITVSPTSGTIYRNQPFTVTVNVLNTGSSTFNGEISLDLHDADGKWVREIGNQPNITLSANHYFTNGLSFSPTALTDTIGTYYLGVWFKPTGGSWEFAGVHGSNQNPKEVLVLDPPITEDALEPNNSEANAYVYQNLNFVNNTCQFNPALNLHNGLDLDFVNLDLAPGYNYTVVARAHDSYNSGDGNTYTVDVKWQYKVKNNDWSYYYDDIASSFDVNGGGVVKFQIFPWFVGSKGTYKFDWKITRTPVTNIDDTKNISDRITVFPNPTHNVVNLSSESVFLPQQIQIRDLTGKVIKNYQIGEAQKMFSFNVANYPKGIYLLQGVATESRLTKKIIVE